MLPKTHQNWRIFYPVDCDFAIKTDSLAARKNRAHFATLGHFLGRKTVRAKWMLDSASPIHQSLAVRSDTVARLMTCLVPPKSARR